MYLTDDPNDAAVLLDRVIAGCLSDEVDEIVSLGNTLRRRRTRILVHHLTGASNGPDRGDEPASEEDQALRDRLQELPQLPTTHPLAPWRHQMWDAHPATRMRARSPQLVAYSRYSGF